MISTTTTKAPTYAGAFAVRGTAVGGFGMPVLDLGTALPVRLRRAEGVPATGLRTGATVQLNIDTPGDLPPRDPLS